jgi:hypothetical protein
VISEDTNGDLDALRDNAASVAGRSFACLINAADMGFGAVTSDPVTFWVTYLNASAAGYAWLTLRTRNSRTCWPRP